MEQLRGSIILIGLLLVSFIVSSCSINNGGEAENTVVPQIFVFPGEQELRLISEEQIPQNNCDGSAETSQTIERQHQVIYSLELGSGIQVSADGRAKIPEIGEVGVGIEVATNYKVGYGREESIRRSITVAAKEGTNIQHTIRQYEVWEIGEVLVVMGENNQRLPYSFRRDFSIEALPPANIGNCSGSTTIPVETKPENTSTVRPTQHPLCPFTITQSEINSFSIGIADVPTVQNYINQFDAKRPSDGGSFVKGTLIPAGVVVATNFDEVNPNKWSEYPVIALVHSGSWGLFQTTGEYVAPNAGACRFMVP